ncbi:MAG: hypothetical protein L3J91_04735, partial [Thermoplasmata archaeon]|nr:hypothetical protein [Thermoplasmata archaeon]
ALGRMGTALMAAALKTREMTPASPPVAPTPRLFLGHGTPRGYGYRPRLSPEAAAAFATYVDPARARAAMQGRTLVYTVRWG